MQQVNQNKVNICNNSVIVLGEMVSDAEGETNVTIITKSQNMNIIRIIIIIIITIMITMFQYIITIPPIGHNPVMAGLRLIGRNDFIPQILKLNLICSKI